MNVSSNIIRTHSASVGPIAQPIGEAPADSASVTGLLSIAIMGTTSSSTIVPFAEESVLQKKTTYSRITAAKHRSSNNGAAMNTIIRSE